MKKPMKRLKECINPISKKTGIRIFNLLKIPSMKDSETGKNNVLFVITTYNRPESLIYILDHLYGHGDIIVYNDGSTLEYFGIEHYKGIHYLNCKENMGRFGYYQTINYILQYIKKLKKYKYYVFCPDDFEPVSGFLRKSIEIWENIHDTKKICLNLYSDKGRFMKSSWNGFPVEVYDEYLKTGWVDMCFLCEYSFFEAIEWFISIPSFRTMSSGVGKDISQRLVGRYSLYQVKFSMFRCLPDGRFSKMFQHERHMPDKVEMIKRILRKKEKIIGIASIPKREKMLKRTYLSLIDQCDNMIIALNGYKKIPEFITDKRCKTFFTDNRYGDAAKFSLALSDCYYFSCDDDIIYPSNYVQFMSEKLEFYGNNCIITLHGSIMQSKPLKSYYKGFQERFNLFYDIDRDRRLDVGGSGVMCFDTEYFRMDYRKCIWPNMADIWVTKFAIQQNIPVILASHKGSDFEYQQSDDNIYARHSKDDKIQTQLYNNL